MLLQNIEPNLTEEQGKKIADHIGKKVMGILDGTYTPNADDKGLEWIVFYTYMDMFVHKDIA